MGNMDGPYGVLCRITRIPKRLSARMLVGDAYSAKENLTGRDGCMANKVSISESFGCGVFRSK